MSSLTAGELEVMQVLWEHGELKPLQIQEKHARPIKNAALRFQLKVLFEKGHVTRRKMGKAYFYKAATRRESALKTIACRMARVFSKGSPPALIAELVKSEGLTEEEIDELKQYATGQGVERSREGKGGKKS